ncbi:MAG: hypothetical protein J0H54_01845 [Rhizobiales bacterium]|nr:hypothetical protein [Hyphomicrobiales bacterium]
MTTWFHTAILATCVAATVAVGLAGAAAYNDVHYPLAKKTDRLETVALDAASPAVTVEHRTDGISILTRVPATILD